MTIGMKRWGVATASVVVLGGTVASALFSNDGFETGTFSSWTKATFLNPGLSGAQPFTGASIVRNAGGSDVSVIVGGPSATPFSQPDGVLGAGATLRYPRTGHYSAVVNYNLNNQNANTLVQTATVGPADVDSFDGKVHVRLTYAPVLEDPSHNPDEQPFFYISVRNVTRGTLMFEDFTYANEPGLPWHVQGGYKYLDWRMADVAPGNGALAVGDQVRIEAIGAGCSLTGHRGWVYLDDIDSQIHSLTLTATAAAQVNPNSDLVYTYVYRNPSATTYTNAVASIAIPAQTTFVGVSDAGHCTFNAGANRVDCAFGTIAANAPPATFTMTVHTDPGASGQVLHGNYFIQADSYLPLYGSLVTTDVTADTLVDLAVSVSDGVSVVNVGDPVSYAVVVSNHGTNAVTGATVSNPVPANLGSATWTCAASSGASCAASGAGGINDVVNLPVGSHVTYTFAGTVTGGPVVTEIASVTLPGGTADIDLTDNTFTDVDQINTAPTATDDAFTVLEDHVLTTPASGVLANDSDPQGSPVTAVLAVAPVHGTLTLAANGSFVYTPSVNYHGSDSFTYRASDGSLTSGTATVTITVTPGTLGTAGHYPRVGRAAGGTKVFVTGTGFIGTGTPAITVGGVPAPYVLVIDDEHLVFVAPPLAVGPLYDIVIAVPGSGTTTIPAGYRTVDDTDADATTDTDGDGMTDLYEKQHSLDPADPTDPALDPDGDGVTNLTESLQQHNPRAVFVRHFADGANSSFFTTWITLLNPTTFPADVLLRMVETNGQVVSKVLTVAPQARATVNAIEVPGLTGEFGTSVEADAQIVAERTMMWDGRAYGGATEESTLTSTTWYFAEGATHSNFDVFYLLMNPGETAANVTVRYLPQAGAPFTRTIDVPANSRRTIWVNAQVPELTEGDFGAIFTSTQPIVAERAMYVSSGSVLFAGGHEAIGLTAPALRLSFAEGAGDMFDPFLLLANPSPSVTAQVEVTYLRTDDAPIVRTYDVLPESRHTVWIKPEIPALAKASFSIDVRSLNNVPVLAERAMWWNVGGDVGLEGHVSQGTPVLGPRWGIAEGYADAAGNVSPWVLIGNMSLVAGDVDVTVYFDDGSSPVTRRYHVDAQRRLTVWVPFDFPSAVGKRFGVTVFTAPGQTLDLVVDHSLYWSALGIPYAAGTSALGQRLP
ncbi:MAG: Ig-like domain-containing protein [Vicinamibacterales bacterium]